MPGKPTSIGSDHAKRLDASNSNSRPPSAYRVCSTSVAKMVRRIADLKTIAAAT